MAGGVNPCVCQAQSLTGLVDVIQDLFITGVTIMKLHNRLKKRFVPALGETRTQLWNAKDLRRLAPIMVAARAQDSVIFNQLSVASTDIIAGSSGHPGFFERREFSVHCRHPRPHRLYFYHPS